MNSNQHIIPEKTPAKVFLAFIGLLVSILYLSNISFGFIEIIPDSIPLVGNLDEVFFAGLLFKCLDYLGIPVSSLLFGTKSNGQSKKAS